MIDAYMMTGSSFSEACEKLFERAGISYDFTERGAVSNRNYKYPRPSLSDNKDKVYEYWATRKISPATIDYMGIEEDTSGNTLFMYYDLDDVLVTCKVRPSRPVPKGENKIWHLPGSDHQNILYNINKVNTQKPLIICSGEGDACALVEAGFHNTTSINGGDGNFQWVSECWDFLEQFDEILVVPDNDTSGAKWRKEVSTRLGEYRVKVVDIPKTLVSTDGRRVKIKDANELLYYGGVEALRDAVNSAAESEIATVTDYSDVKQFDMSEVEGFTSGFSELDNALDKFYVGTTNILTGISGSGKSSFLSSVICKSVEQGFPVFVYSGELSNPSLKNWIDCVHAGQRNINQYQGVGSKYYRIRTTAYDRINAFYKGQIFFYRDGFDQKASSVLSTMESVVRRYGVKTIIIDNMSSIDLESDDKNKYIKQDEFIRNVINFSKRWQVDAWVVIHPKKMDMVRRMSIFDLQGVVSAVNLAHRVISLYRVQPKEKEGLINNRTGKVITPPNPWDVELEILKDRFGSGTGKKVGLYYDIPSRRFFDSYETLNHQYAWDQADYGTAPLPYPPPQLEEEKEVFGDYA